MLTEQQFEDAVLQMVQTGGQLPLWARMAQPGTRQDLAAKTLTIAWKNYKDMDPADIPAAIRRNRQQS